MFTANQRQMDRASSFFLGVKVDKFATDESIADRSTLAGDSSPANTISRQTSCSSEDVWGSVRESFFKVDESKTRGKPRQFKKKVVDAPVEANLPADFGMAWNNAAKHVSGWKRNMHESRKRTFKKGVDQKATTRTKEASSLSLNSPPGLVPSEANDCVQGIPLPRSLLSMSPRSSVESADTADQSPKSQITTESSDADDEEECTGMLMCTGVQFYIAVPITAFQPQCTKVNAEQAAPMQAKDVEVTAPALDEEPLKVHIRVSDEPLKIDMSSLSTFSSLKLDPATPCKRSLPDWRF